LGRRQITRIGAFRRVDLVSGFLALGLHGRYGRSVSVPQNHFSWETETGLTRDWFESGRLPGCARSSRSRRLDFLLWAVPAILVSAVFLLLSPKEVHRSGAGAAAIGALWWPDWKNPLIWLLGFTFGSNNSPFFTMNAFLGDYLVSRGQGDLLGRALTSLNGAQAFGLVGLVLVAGRLQRRAWPFLLFGPVMLAGFVGLIVMQSPFAVLVCTGLIGVSTVMTMTPILALPLFLAAPADVARTAAGMLTISYSCAIIVPTICGALWDMSGKPWTVFVPLSVCAVGLTVLGAIVSRRRPAAHAAHS
jgi:MFS transporter, CP family, cyanate transporter